jgi:hypothetical protein
MAEDVKSMLELDLEAKGNKLVEAAAWAYPVPEGVYGVWEMNAVKVEKADGTEAVGSWLSVSFLLDLQWSSTIDQKVKLYAVDDVAGEVSTFGPPDPNELKADVAPDDPTIASAQECLGS